MLTPKFKEFAAVFQWGAVALFAKYARKGRLEDWERFYKKNKEALADWNKVDIDAIVDEIEDYLLTSLPKDEREPYLFDIITAFKDWVRDKDSLGEKIIYQDDYVGVWATLFYVFVTKFYAMLLKHGIDMMRLQEECDVYLQKEVNEGVTKLYIGSSKLAHKYIEAIQAKREPQQEEKPVNEAKYQQEEKNAVEPREINQERLSEYFTLKFLGRNSSNTNYMTEYLMLDLKKKMNAKYYAKIFLLMYDSPNLKPSMKPRTFTKFYQDMCEITGVEFIDGYKPNQLQMNEEEKKQYWYLTDKIK